MEVLKQTLFTGWHFMRWFRLGIAIFLGIQAIQMHHPVAGFVAAFFLFQALTNTGCCGVTGCAAPMNRKTSDAIEEVEYEEITSVDTIKGKAVK